MTLLVIFGWLCLGATIGAFAMALMAASKHSEDAEEAYWEGYINASRKEEK